MATTKIINSKSSLASVIDYVLDKTKLEVVSTDYMLSTDMSPSSIKHEMFDTKRTFEKEGGREYCHIVVSYHPDEYISPLEANQLAHVFTERIPEFRNHEVLYATQVHPHPNGIGCVHTHIIVNSVDFVDGSKLHLSKDFIGEIRDVTDDICRENDMDICIKGKDFHRNDLDIEHKHWDMASYIISKDPDKVLFKDLVAAELTTELKFATSRDELADALETKGIHAVWNDEHNRVEFYDIENESHKIFSQTLANDYDIPCDIDSIDKELEMNAWREDAVDYDPVD